MRPFGLAVIAALLLAPLYWWPALAATSPAGALFSQYLGLWALIAMGLGQIIATKLPLIETVFGPMDQSYRLHKWLGIGGFVTVLMHDTIDAEITGIPAGALVDLSETMGDLSLNGLIFFLAVTVLTFIPYNIWKWTHRLIGICFLMGAFHYLFTQKPFANTDPLGIYMMVICGLGTLAYIYTSAPRVVRPFRDYKITKLEPQGAGMAVDMAPAGKPLRHEAGQFAFVSFVEAGLTEPHPFTLSSAPNEDGTLRVTIAPLGDYTNRVLGRLKDGGAVRVEGPFGRFGRGVRGRQIWVAAGIGVTPFVALAQRLRPEDGEVTLILSAKHAADAPHASELQALAAEKTNLELVIWESASRGRLDAAAIAQIAGELKQAKVLFCGPVPMRKALGAGLRALGVPARRYHYEQFEIRTGIGLQWVLNWLWARRDVVLKRGRA